MIYNKRYVLKKAYLILFNGGDSMRGEPIISIRNLVKNFDDKQVLKGIDLDVYSGDIIGYIGPNGAGKSTTVKIMLGLIKDFGGQVNIFGKDIKSSGVDYKKKIGYVPEVPDIYDNLTAREYSEFIGVVYGMTSEEVEEKTLKLMKVFGIEGAYGSRLESYSKGMKQKFLIACSMIHDPDILFLDEPIGGLDANSVMVFKEVLTKLSGMGKTIFYSSHIMDVVEKISNRIVLLNDGKVAADGTFEELKAANHEDSLENIFTDITGVNDHSSKADDFVTAVKGE